MLVAIWHMLTSDNSYHDPGADFYQRLAPDRAKHKAIAQLHALGYEVTVQPLQAAGRDHLRIRKFEVLLL